MIFWIDKRWAIPLLPVRHTQTRTYCTLSYCWQIKMTSEKNFMSSESHRFRHRLRRTSLSAFSLRTKGVNGWITEKQSVHCMPVSKLLFFSFFLSLRLGIVKMDKERKKCLFKKKSGGWRSFPFRALDKAGPRPHFSYFHPANYIHTKNTPKTSSRSKVFLKPSKITSAF